MFLLPNYLYDVVSLCELNKIKIAPCQFIKEAVYYENNIHNFNACY